MHTSRSVASILAVDVAIPGTAYVPIATVAITPESSGSRFRVSAHVSFARSGGGTQNCLWRIQYGLTGAEAIQQAVAETVGSGSVAAVAIESHFLALGTGEHTFILEGAMDGSTGTMTVDALTNPTEESGTLSVEELSS